MSYIEKLQKKKHQYELFLNELGQYLNLKKFNYPNNMVNKDDIILRIDELNSALIDIDYMKG
jgi:hypothetical protein